MILEGIFIILLMIFAVLFGSWIGTKIPDPESYPGMSLTDKIDIDLWLDE
jgi:hypothetical protein